MGHIHKICNILETGVGLSQREVLFQHLVSLRVHSLLFLGTTLAMGAPGDGLTGQSVGKMIGGCEVLKPQFPQDTVAAEEAVAECLIKQMK